jgi:Zn-dependent protease
MAEFDSIPRKPSSELLIAFAGPAVNFVIVAIMVICLVPFPGEQIAVIVKSVFSPSAYENVSIDMTLQQEFLTMNLVMGCFNLVPVYPMDGGRVLRALLATRLNYLQATFYAATIAKILASIAIIAALCHERWLIAALFTFIFFAGEMEYRSIKRREREEARWRRMVAQLDIATAARRPLPNMRSGGQ